MIDDEWGLEFAGVKDLRRCSRCGELVMVVMDLADPGLEREFEQRLARHSCGEG